MTGASGGLGRLTADWLARRGARRLALLSRGAWSQEGEALIQSLRERNVEVDVARVDVAEREQIALTLERLRAIAPIRGVVHSAGVLKDGLLSAAVWDEWRGVFSAKVHGAMNLHELTLGDELDMFVLYSSIAGIRLARLECSRRRSRRRN